jgi:hypothetical protein
VAVGGDGFTVFMLALLIIIHLNMDFTQAVLEIPSC